MKKLVLVTRYGGKLDTVQKIKEFNNFYDLEEARLNHEDQIEKDFEKEELTRIILQKGKSWEDHKKEMRKRGLEGW